jgi:hypothetical protein
VCVCVCVCFVFLYFVLLLELGPSKVAVRHEQQQELQE